MSGSVTVNRSQVSYRVVVTTAPGRELTVLDVLDFADSLRELIRTDGLSTNHPVLGERSGFRLAQLRVSFDVEVSR